jgi:hypothetical protein
MKLVAFNLSDGNVEIHRAGCADIKRTQRNRKGGHWRQDQVEFGKVDWPTKYDFAHDYWDNGILEEHEAENGVGSFDVMQEMDFAPCCDELPEGGREVAAPAAPSRTAKEARRIAREILFDGIRNRLNDSLLQGDEEVYRLMLEQAGRVAHMFGLSDDPGFNLTGK